MRIPDQIVHSWAGKTETSPLAGSCISFGRSAVHDCIHGAESGLSREHLVFERADNGWIARDLASKNGTHVNGSLITEPQRLRPGDNVAAGAQVISSCASEKDASPRVRINEGGGGTFTSLPASYRLTINARRSGMSVTPRRRVAESGPGPWRRPLEQGRKRRILPGECEEDPGVG